MDKRDDTTYLSKDEDPIEKVCEYQRAVAEDRHDSVVSAYSEGKAKAEDADDLEDTRPLRDEFERRYPGQRTSTIVKGFLALDEQMRADPVNSAHKVAELYARHSRFGDPKEDKPIEGAGGTIGIKLPNGEIRYEHPGTVGHAIALSMVQSGKDTGEVGQLREMQTLLKKRYPHETFSNALKKVLDFDHEANKDPYKAAARLGATYGMPINDDQAAHEQHTERARQVVNQYIDAEFPFLKGREKDINRLVKNETVQATGDLRADLARIEAVIRYRDTCKAEAKALRAKHPDFNLYQERVTELMDQGKADSITAAYHKAKAMSAKPMSGLTDDLKAAMKRAG